MGIERIQVYEFWFSVCLGMTLSGMILSVISFFTLHIKDAWRMNIRRARTGKNWEHGKEKEQNTEILPEKVQFSIIRNVMVVHTKEKI